MALDGMTVLINDLFIVTNKYVHYYISLRNINHGTDTDTHYSCSSSDWTI